MSHPIPPHWARRLIELMVHGDEREFVLGDLTEMFAHRTSEVGRTRATIAYLSWGVRSAARHFGMESLAGIRGDVRLAIRQFRRNPRVYLGGTIVLALGLGVGTFSWGIYHGSFGRGLPVAASDRIFDVALHDVETRTLTFGVSVRDAERLSSSVTELELVGLWASTSVHLNDAEGLAEKVPTLHVSAPMFDLLEITPLHGRLLTPSDAEPGAPPVVVMGHALWARRYESDPELPGKTIRIDGRPTTVVGVLAEGERFVGEDLLWLPVGPNIDEVARGFSAIVRVRDGVDAKSLDDRLAAQALRFADGGQDEWSGVVPRVIPFGASMRGPNASVGTRVMSSAGVLLFLMALANVANLFLVRAQVRTRELAVRRALGAGRGRIIRQIVLEAAIPALLGLAGGAAVAAAGLAWYEAASLEYGGGVPGPIWVRYELEFAHFLLLAVGAFGSTVFVSLVTGVRALSRSGSAPLRSGRGTAGGHFRVGQTFLAVEVAVGCTLLLLASLLGRSWWNLRTIDYGFLTEAVISGEVELEPTAYDSAEKRAQFWRELEAGLRDVPGVRSVALGTQLPMIRYRGSASIEIEGWQFEDPADLPVHYRNRVSPDYFDTFQAPPLAGRAFTAADGPDSEPVALLNESFARRYFPEEVPIGRRVRVWDGGEPGPWRTVIGVAPHLWMDTDVNQRPEGIYIPLAQSAPAYMQIALQVGGAPSSYATSIRAVVASLDPELPVLNLQSMPELIRNRTRFYRFQSPPLIAVGLAALLLALGGLYTVVSYMSSLRTAEFGVRAALGAARLELIRLAIGSVWVPTVVGVVVGVVFGRALTTGFDRWVFLVEPSSPGVTAMSLGVFVVTAAVASLVPAFRASRVDIVRVLEAD